MSQRPLTYACNPIVIRIFRPAAVAVRVAAHVLHVWPARAIYTACTANPAGRSFGDIRRQFHSATLCGVLPAAVRFPGGRRGPAYPVASAAAASAAAESVGSMGSLGDVNGGGGGGGNGGRVVFCPPDFQRVRQRDQLVLLADRRAACVPSDTWAEVSVRAYRTQLLLQLRCTTFFGYPVTTWCN